jgi:excisionase family DNA binding protein
MTLAALRVALDAAVAELPAAELPDLVGLLAAALARAQIHLVTPPPAPVPVECLTAAQVADAFNVPRSMIYELARRGDIPCQHLGKYRRFNLDAVRQALNRGAGSESVSLKPPTRRRRGAGFSGPATTAQPGAAVGKGAA